MRKYSASNTEGAAGGERGARSCRAHANARIVSPRARRESAIEALKPLQAGPAVEREGNNGAGRAPSHGGQIAQVSFQ